MSAPDLAPLDLSVLDGRELVELAVRLNRGYAAYFAMYAAMLRWAPGEFWSGQGIDRDLIRAATEAEYEVQRRLEHAGGAR